MGEVYPVRGEWKSKQSMTIQIVLSIKKKLYSALFQQRKSAGRLPYLNTHWVTSTSHKITDLFTLSPGEKGSPKQTFDGAVSLADVGGGRGWVPGASSCRFRSTTPAGGLFQCKPRSSMRQEPHLTSATYLPTAYCTPARHGDLHVQSAG